VSPGRVVALAVAAERGGEVRAVEQVEVEAGAGIVGDRYHGSRHRHVSLQSATDLAAAADDLGVAVPPTSTRRNVTVDAGPVPTTPGTRLLVGEGEAAVLLEVVRVAAPCPVMDRSVAPGARTALRRRGGAVLRALSSGTVRVGDPVALVPEP